jgi:hypothetical protein
LTGLVDVKVYSIVLGVAGGAIMKTVSISQGPLAGLAKHFLTTAMTAHVTLSLFATLFITSTLIQHRRMIKSSSSTPVKGYLDRLIEMILESSAPNVPLTIIAIVGVTTENVYYGNILLSIVVPGQVSAVTLRCPGTYCLLQSFASVLLLYRIALGKAIGAKSDKEEALDVA